MQTDPPDRDSRFMRTALDLAARGLGRVEPNPMVGCVIVQNDQVVGRGYHQRFGGPHAEIEALRDCPGPQATQGATAYVTLEPCCHHGKTPPCTDALIDAQVSRVVIAMEDPFEQVDGGGVSLLRQAGIETKIGTLRDQAEALNAPYFKRITARKPWVIAKWAMTADGRIATSTGESQWITGNASRAEVHRLRGRVDAIVAGMGTVEADDPLLTARPTGPRVATRVVLCRNRLPSVTSKLVGSVNDAPLLLFTSPSLSLPIHPLVERGVEVVSCQSTTRAEMITETLDELGRRQMTNVMVEGGGELLASFFDAGQIDECRVYVGSKTFGGAGAPGPIGGLGVSRIADAMRLKLIQLDQYDDDIRAVYRKT